MRVVLNQSHVILVPENEGETRSLDAWAAGRDRHVFVEHPRKGRGLALRDLGRRDQVCQEPINVWSRSPDPMIRLIGNFAPTPFEMDGNCFHSVESFWQGLKSQDPVERARIASLDGAQAKRAGKKLAYGATVTYQTQQIPVGTWLHWSLMERACRAKFAQNSDAASALLATSDRPLVHRVRRDSRIIPGVIMAQIWTKIRRDFKDQYNYYNNIYCNLFRNIVCPHTPKNEE
jgi:predicted NAD-dependent protein-ADP-ribosyltransferase YbiA (DUF1768 family)